MGGPLLSMAKANDCCRDVVIHAKNVSHMEYVDRRAQADEILWVRFHTVHSVL